MDGVKDARERESTVTCYILHFLYHFLAFLHTPRTNIVVLGRLRNKTRPFPPFIVVTPKVQAPFMDSIKKQIARSKI